MKILKLILFLLFLGVGAYAIVWFLGLVLSLFWYFVAGFLVIGGGYIGYKLLVSKDEDKPQMLEHEIPTSIGEMQRLDRVLEEYKEIVDREENIK
ncbi:MAG: hypothetical protein ACK5NT_10750 [Pyrinomonadaceae bacterium]